MRYIDLGYPLFIFPKITNTRFKCKKFFQLICFTLPLNSFKVSIVVKKIVLRWFTLYSLSACLLTVWIYKIWDLIWDLKFEVRVTNLLVTLTVLVLIL